MFKSRSVRLALGVALVLGASACGDDGTTEEASGSVPTDDAPACEVVGSGDGTAVEVSLDEWGITAAPATVAAGDVTFTVHNIGHEPHELVVVRASSPTELSVVEGRVDEDALPDGAFIGEVEAFAAATSCAGTFSLAPGSYVLFCNLVEEHDGAMESHFNNGMSTMFTVA
jgi:hypothetical protein